MSRRRKRIYRSRRRFSLQQRRRRFGGFGDYRHLRKALTARAVARRSSLGVRYHNVVKNNACISRYSGVENRLKAEPLSSATNLEGLVLLIKRACSCIKRGHTTSVPVELKRPSGFYFARELAAAKPKCMACGSGLAWPG